MKRVAVVTVAALTLLACGDDDNQAEDTTTSSTTTETTAPATESIEVNVTGTVVFSGCTQALQRGGFEIGNSQRVTLEDGDGNVLGVGDFDLTPGADSCDWTATIEDVPADADFYTFVAGDELATVSRSELEDSGWELDAHIEVDGSVSIG